MQKALIGISAAAAFAAVSLVAPVSANAQTAATPQAITIQAETAESAACRTIVITGSNVGVRQFPFNNADILRSRDTGKTLTSCKLLRGNGSNGYTSRCGRPGGRNWFVVRIPRTVDSIGLVTTTGYVPVACAKYRK